MDNKQQKKKDKKIIGIVFGSIGGVTLAAGAVMLGINMSQNNSYATVKFDANGATFKNAFADLESTNPYKNNYIWFIYEKNWFRYRHSC